MTRADVRIEFVGPTVAEAVFWLGVLALAVVAWIAWLRWGRR